MTRHFTDIPFSKPVEPVVPVLYVSLPPSLSFPPLFHFVSPVGSKQKEATNDRVEMASILTRGAGRRQKQQARAPRGARRVVLASDEQEMAAPASLKRPRTGSAHAGSDRLDTEQQAALARSVRGMLQR